MRLVRAYFYDVWSLLLEAKVPLLGFVVLTLVDVLYLSLVYGHQPLRALSETINMYVFEVSLDWPEGDVFGQILLFFVTPLLGVALIFQSIMDFSRHLLDKNTRREAWQIALAGVFRNHVIICGLGRVSYRIMMQLLETGYEVVVIEKNWNSPFVHEALKHRTPVVSGDATDAEVLRQAGLHRAHGLIASTNNDLENIEIALAARREREDIRTVMRIFNDELDTNLERSFGPNSAFSSSALGAPTLAVAAISCNIAYVLPLSEGVLGISEVVVAPNSLLTGFAAQIEECYHVRVLYWLGKGKQWTEPPSGVRIEGGDTLLLLGTVDSLDLVRRDNQQGSKIRFLEPSLPQHPTERLNTVIVCGLGKVGYRVVKALYLHRPRPEIVVVEALADKSGPLVKELQAQGIRIVRGDARVSEVLHEAGLDRAYSIAAVTSDNLVNIQIGLVARRMRSDIDVVLRVFSAALAEQLDTIFGAYTAFSTSALAAPTMAAAALDAGISYALNIGGRLLSAIEVPVLAGDEFVGKSVEQIFTETRVAVIAVCRRDERALMPGPKLVLEAGDEIEVLADLKMIERLRARARTRGKIHTDRLVAPRMG